MKTDEEVRTFARRMIDKGVKNPSAIVLTSYYYGFDWRFDKMRAFVDQEVKNYTQELLRKSK